MSDGKFQPNGCDRTPRCGQYDCQRTREFAAVMIDRYAGGPDADAVKTAADDYAAGEWECAAISAVEVVAATSDEIDELERIADACMDGIDLNVAHLVISKKRSARH